MEAEQWNLHGWYWNFAEQIGRLRGLRHTGNAQKTYQDSLQAIFETLERRKYTRSQAQQAEYWCRYGKWPISKLSIGLSIEDFFPTAEALQNLRGVSGRYLSQAEIQRLHREAYEKGKRDAEAKQDKPARSAEVKKLQKGFLTHLEYSKKLEDLETELLKKDRQIERLQKTIQGYTELQKVAV